MIEATIISGIIETTDGVLEYTTHKIADEVDPSALETYVEIAGPPQGIPDPNTAIGRYVLGDAHFWQVANNPAYFVVSYKEL